MDKKTLRTKRIPDAPGVYFFLGAKREVLYIGRATSLSRRVESYFDPDIAVKRGFLIEKMVRTAKRVEWVETDSVLEAIMLEVNLIRTHRPPYNTISKDDKSYNHVAITDEEHPRVIVLRGKDLRDETEGIRYKNVYGPFPSGKLLKDALKIIQRIFRFYDIRIPLGGRLSKLHRGIIDFNRQIGLYPDSVSDEEYRATIRHLMLFFEGKKATVMRELTREMKRLAREEKFEEADRVKKKLVALQHIQDVSLIKDEYREYRDSRRIRIEGYDIAHLQGSHMVGVMTVIEDGERDSASYRTFIIRTVFAPHDPAALKEVLTRRLSHGEWRFPDLIVVDGNAVQKRAAESVIKKAGLFIPVVAVVKDERHRPKGIVGMTGLVLEHRPSILLANAEAHRFSLGFHRKRRRKLP